MELGSMIDKINPPHYKNKSIETIDAIESQLSSEEFKGYCKGNALKYISRSGLKYENTEEEDLMKAQWYLNRVLSVLQRPKINKG
jgi:hypothetical protein